jgi:hypothetical protein
MSKEAVSVTTAPAFIPPGTPDPMSHCYICSGAIGVFAWTDCDGRAHPWCVPGEKEKWQ